MSEEIIATKKKYNMKLYVIHKMLTADLLFYYGIKFLFLTQIKGLTASDIVLASAFWGLFKLILQIPATVIVEKIGNRKSLIFADLNLAFSTVLVMLSSNLITLIIANFFSAVSSATREVADAGILNESIPETESRSKIFSKLEGKGIGYNYYLAAISAIISGFLFDINGYIPMSICVAILLFATILSRKFYEINPIKKQEKNKINPNKITVLQKYKKYFKDLKLAFSFIFNSKRLKALMVFATIMYGMIMAMNTYEMALLEEIELSASITGIIYAVMQVIAGIASRNENILHERLKNKTLATIGISYTLACLIAGAISLTSINYVVIITIITLTYSIRYLGTGAYYVLIKKYLSNFSNKEVSDKVYSAYGLVTGFGNVLICTLSSMLVSKCNLKYSMIIFGSIGTIIMIAVVKFMKERVGLKPNEYKKEDIDYKEYISLK